MPYNPSVARFKTDMTELVNRAKQNFHQTLLLQAEELAGNIREAAPKLTGALAASVRVRDVSTSDGTKLSVLVIAGGQKTTRRGAGGVYDYALATEFGTVKEPAEPFFYNSARLYSKNGLEQYKETLAETIAENNKVRGIRGNNYTTNPGYSGATIAVGHRGAVVLKGKL